MLSMFKRTPKPAVEAEAILEAPAPAGIIEADHAEAPDDPAPVRRAKQQNIKASEDCCALFDALAKALKMTKADLFEDMVVERYEAVRRQGVQVEMAAG